MYIGYIWLCLPPSMRATFLSTHPASHPSTSTSSRDIHLPLGLVASDVSHHMLLGLVHSVHFRRDNAAAPALNLLSLVNGADMSLNSALAKPSQSLRKQSPSLTVGNIFNLSSSASCPLNCNQNSVPPKIASPIDNP